MPNKQSDPESAEPIVERTAHSVHNFVLLFLGIALVAAVAAVIGLAIWGAGRDTSCPTTVASPGLWRQVLTPGPSGRLAHAAIDVDDKVMYIHGGLYGFSNGSLSDLWTYTEATDTWVQITATGDIPPARFHHTLVNVDNQELILFGGFNVFNTLPTHDSFDDMYTLNLKTHRWTRIDNTITGVKPTRRGAHDAVFYNGNMYIFGGFPKIGNTGQTQEFWRFEVASKQWFNMTPASPTSSVSSSTYPAGRIGFAWAVIGNIAYMYGGACPDGVDTEDTGQCSDMWAYDLILSTWSRINPSTTLGNGEHPENRRSTNADDAVDGIMYLFGGVNINTTIPTAPIITMFDDFWAFDTATNRWFELYPNFQKPPKPPATFGHSVVRLNDKIVVFGGRIVAPTNPGSSQTWEYATITRT